MSDHRHAALAAPLPEASRSRSSHRRRCAAALTAASRSAAAAPRRRLSPLALRSATSGARPLHMAVGGGVASCPQVAAVARLSTPRLRRRACGRCTGAIAPQRARRRRARPPRLRGGGSRLDSARRIGSAPRCPAAGGCARHVLRLRAAHARRRCAVRALAPRRTYQPRLPPHLAAPRAPATGYNRQTWRPTCACAARCALRGVTGGARSLRVAVSAGASRSATSAAAPRRRRSASSPTSRRACCTSTRGCARAPLGHTPPS